MARDRIRLLRQERAQLATQMREILTGAETENRALSAEEDQRWSALNAEVDAKAAEIQRLERQVELDRELQAAPEYARQEERTPADDQEARQKAVGKAFRSWLRHGVSGMDDEQRSLLPIGVQGSREILQVRGPRPEDEEFRAQAEDTGAHGAYVVAPTFYNQLTEAMLAFGGMRMAPTTKIMTDTGAQLQMPTVNDTTNKGRILGENVTVTETDFTFAQKVLNAYTFTSDSVLVPVTLLQDSAFPLDAFIARKLGERIGRIQNDKFTTGTGTNEPRGILTDAVLGRTGVTTGKGGAAQYTDLVELEHSVDPAYRDPGTARWMGSDSAIKALKQLVDGNARPLWQPLLGPSGIGGNFSDTILDFPYVVNQSMPAVATSAKSLIFGDMSSYYLRDVRDVTLLRLVERYADALQVGFIGFARADGILLDAGTNPVKYYAGPSS